MSEILKRIITSRAKNEDSFITNAEGKIYEKQLQGEALFTGYYEDATGKYYDEDSWKVEQQRLFDKFQKIEEEKRIDALEKRRKEMEALKLEKIRKAIDPKPKKRKKSYMYIALFTIVAISVLAYGYFDRKKEPTQEEETLVVTEEKVEEEEVLFGNAIVTGDEVNIRMEPTINSEIISSFPKMGERIQLIRRDTIVSKWKFMQRENGERGWVYDLYIKQLDTLTY